MVCFFISEMRILFYYGETLTVKQVWVVDTLPKIHQDVQQSVLVALMISKSL